jgi:hypothetical protein
VHENIFSVLATHAPPWFAQAFRHYLETGDVSEVEQGEGTPNTPLDNTGDFAHDYRFAEIFHGGSSRIRRRRREPRPTAFPFRGRGIRCRRGFRSTDESQKRRLPSRAPGDNHIVVNQRRRKSG